MAVPPELMALIDQASQGGPDTPGPIDDSAGVAPPNPAGPDTGGPPGPDALVGGPDTGGPVGPDNIVGGPGETPPTDLTPVDALRNIISSIEEYQAIEQDDQDLAEAAKVYALVQKLLAKNQQQQEAAAGVTPVHKGLARAQAAGPAPAEGY